MAHRGVGWGDVVWEVIVISLVFCPNSDNYRCSTVLDRLRYAPINEMPHLPPPGAGGGFANRGGLNPHPWGPKFWLIPHYFVYYLDIIT